jgi:ABC-type transport system involved in cytochrome c biogenesis permease subunit
LLALIGLGAGLVTSAWWAWRSVGGLAGDDPRQAWMAITWLLSAMSLLAWQLEAAAARWAAALAGLAATVAIGGLLAVPYIVRLLGF